MIELALSILWWFSTIVGLLVVVSILSATGFYLWINNNELSKSCKKIPFSQYWPIISYWQMLRVAYRRKYPRVFLFQLMNAYCRFFEQERISLIWVGFRPLIFIYKPEFAEILLNNSSTITKSVEYDFLKPWLGTGLLTSTGEKWRSHRKLLTPTFHFQILENFVSTFNEQATILTKKMESAVKEPWINIIPMMTMCTLDIICQTAMGVHLNTQSGCGKEYLESLAQMSDIFFYRAVRPWLWFNPIFYNFFPSGWQFRKNLKRLQDFTRKVIKEKKEYMLRQDLEGKHDEDLKPRKKAFLELLLEHHLKDNSFTEENIREEVDTFTFEGHDTTAVSLSWTLYELGQNQEIQEKVYQELESIFGDDKEREVTSDDLKQMKYLECTIKETLRLYPSVPFIGRQLKEKFNFKEYTLLPGCTCFVFIYLLHRDPEQFPEPEVFNPDRFLPENSNKRHPYAYIPFSAGPRNCIGQKFALMEEKTVLAHILRKFKVASLDPRDKMEMEAGIILKNTEPIRIKLELRSVNE